MTWTNFLKDVISPGDLMHKDTSHVLMITDSTASAQLSPLSLRLPFSTAYQIFLPGSPHTSETQHPGQNLLIFPPPPPSLIFSTSLYGTCFHQVTQARNFRVFPGRSLPLNPHPQPFTKPCRPVKFMKYFKHREEYMENIMNTWAPTIQLWLNLNILPYFPHI